MKTSLITDLAPKDLQQWLADNGEPAYRIAQVLDWLYKKWADRFDDMLNLPETLRHTLDDDFRASALDVIDTLRDPEGTVKWLARLGDGEMIESVLIETPRRRTVCVSTQVGCPVRCAFCASGTQGLVRNLTPGEIVDQVRLACRYLGSRINNVVVMGMGEPLLNLNALIPALEAICDRQRMGLGARHVTVSTSGIVPGIRKLASLRRQWHLALSLHAVTDERREKLVPPAFRYPLADVLDACREYRAQTGRIVTLEYALVRNMNDADADAVELSGIARSLDAKINLIPCNPTGRPYQAPQKARVNAFLDALRKHGAKATVRTRKGETIQAACGQLRQRESQTPE